LALNGKENELKEYRLGVDVFGRGADFDPRVDPIARIQAAKLRARLAEYYASEGKDDVIVISIPKGGYIPTFTSVAVSTAPPDSQDVQSIAVLPFVSMSGDPENEFFSDGLTEELINVLTYVPGLRVVARTSAFCFKNTAKDVREIGAQLNVQTVLEGSVRKAGNQLRVTAQLIDVATGYHLLSRTFPRELKDVFAVQEELASAVVTEIMPQVRPETRPIAHHYTANIDIYNLYLKGMLALANRFTGPMDCMPIFRQVLQEDPNYAPAWAGMANAYCMQAWFAMLPPIEAMILGQRAALKAIGLDDTQGLAHTMLGMTQAVMNWDWQSAERSFQKAIQVQPSLAVAHEYYAFTCLMPQQRFEEALRATERALVLNPFDAVMSGAAVLLFAAAGKEGAALRQHALCQEVHPNHPVTHGSVGFVHEMAGRLEEAITAYRTATKLTPHAAFPHAAMGHALAKSGKMEEAKQVLQDYLNSKADGVCACLIYLGLGDHAEALRWLKKGMDAREPHALLPAFDPRFAPLRKHPEFRQLIGQMGLTLTVTA